MPPLSRTMGVVTSETATVGHFALPIPDEPGAERLIARFRSHGRRLFWPALILIGAAGATAYFFGNLPAPFEDWMLLAAAALVILLGAVVPYLVWLSRTYAITTQRVIVSRGLGARHRSELSHSRGYTIAVRRGPLQRIWGTGTITLSDGRGRALRLQNVPNAVLVHETLADQIEIGQILAHRDARALSFDTGEQP